MAAWSGEDGQVSNDKCATSYRARHTHILLHNRTFGLLFTLSNRLGLAIGTGCTCLGSGKVIS